MINFEIYKQKVDAAITEEEIEGILHDALQFSDFVALEFVVENEFLVFSYLSDKKATGPDRLLGGLRLPLPQEARSLNKNTRYLIEDLKVASPYSDILALLTHRGCGQAAILIATIEQKPCRLLALGSRSVTGFDAGDVEQVKSFMDAITNGLERVHAALASEKLRSVYPSIVGISEIFLEEKDLGRVFEQFHKAMEPIFPPEINFICALKDEKANQVTFPYSFMNGRVTQTAPHDLGEGIFSFIIEKNEVLAWDEQSAQTLQKHNIIERSALPRSFLGVPLSFRGKIYGAISIADMNEENKFSEFDKRYFQTVAALFSVFFSTIQSNKNVTHLESEIQKERLFLDQILANSPIQISIKDANAKYLFASSSLLEKYNVPSMVELLGKSDLNILAEADGITTYKDDLDSISAGQPRLNMVTEENLPDGSRLVTTHNKYPLKDTLGKPIGLLEFSWDDTKLKNAEEKISQLQSQDAALREIVELTASSINLPEIIQKLLDVLQKRINPYLVAVYTIDTLKENAILGKATGEYGRLYENKEHKVRLKGKTIFNRVFTDLAPYLLSDVEKDALYDPEPTLPDTKEIYLLPLISNRIINGMLELRSSNQGFFNDELRNFLNQVAQLLSVAISNSSQSERIRETLAKQQSLYSITTSATQATDPQEAINLVVESLAATIPDAQPAFFLPDAEGKLTIVASKGYEGIKVQDIIVKRGEGIVGQAAETLKPIRIDDTNEESSFIPIDPSVRSEITIPVTFSGRLVGILNIESKRVNAFDENDEQILVTLANTLGSILSNVQLVNQIRQQAERQQQLYEISEKIRRSVDVETILQTSAVELGKAIHARRANIEIKPLTQLISETETPETKKGAKS
jgi:GAF domain-containing protein